MVKRRLQAWHRAETLPYKVRQPRLSQSPSKYHVCHRVRSSSSCRMATQSGDRLHQQIYSMLETCPRAMSCHRHKHSIKLSSPRLLPRLLQDGQQLAQSEVDPESVVWGVPQAWVAVQRIVAGREDKQGCGPPCRQLSRLLRQWWRLAQARAGWRCTL